METIIVYLDDADYAQPMLQSMAQSAHAGRTHWVVVACAPRITHRVSKFVSNRSRESWRNKWADKLFAATTPLLVQSGARVTQRLARGPLVELVEELRQELGTSPQIIDLRRPKLEHVAAPALAPAPLMSSKIKLQAGRVMPALLATLASMGVVLEEVLL